MGTLGGIGLCSSHRVNKTHCDSKGDMKVLVLLYRPIGQTKSRVVNFIKYDSNFYNKDWFRNTQSVCSNVEG